MAPQCFRFKGTIVWGILFSLTDVALTTGLFGHGDHYIERFLSDVYRFDIRTSLIELWAFGLARTALILGAVFGFACNPDVAGPRMACSKPVVTVFLTVMWVYTNVKLLMYIDSLQDFRLPWFWALIAWTNVAMVLAYVTWARLASRKTRVIRARMLATVVVDENAEDGRLVDLEAQVDGREEEVKGKEEKEEKKVSSLRTVGRLLQLSLPDWYILMTAFVFMVISAGAEVFIPFYTGQVIQGIVIDKSISAFSRSIVIMGLLSIVSSVSAGLRGGCFKLGMARFQVRVCNRLFAALMQQEIAFYDVTRTGEITSRLTSDTTVMCEALSLNTNIFLRSLIQCLGTIVFMFHLSWRLTMVSVIGLPLLLAVSEAYGQFYKNLSKKVQDSLAKVNEVAEEACSSMRTVRSFANENAEANRYASMLKVTYKLKVKESLAYAGYMWCSDFFSLALVVATLYYGGHLVIVGQLSGGHLVSFILYQMQLGYCLEVIASVYTGMMQAVGASERVFEFIDRKPLIPQSNGLLTPETLRGTLEFRDVTFCYSSRPDINVLQNVNFKVEPGEVVALVGPSGGGKSTIVSLLEHFYETTSGQVLLDGVPIQEYDHKYLHTKITLVGQEPVLYARSVKENIMYGVDEVCSVERVEAAAQQANAHTFITEMKDKYDTQTGEKGMQLSGGQKQRVAIARALIRNPVILLLDEATSALDSESEHVVQEAIYNNLKGRTVIIVAHRLSTVERANRIIVIEKGQVAEQGTHLELLSAGGIYSRLVKRQLLAFNGTSSQHSQCGNTQNPQCETVQNLQCEVMQNPPSAVTSDSQHGITPVQSLLDISNPQCEVMLNQPCEDNQPCIVTRDFQHVFLPVQSLLDIPNPQCEVILNQPCEDNQPCIVTRDLQHGIIPVQSLLDIPNLQCEVTQNQPSAVMMDSHHNIMPVQSPLDIPNPQYEVMQNPSSEDNQPCVVTQDSQHGITPIQSLLDIPNPQYETMQNPPYEDNQPCVVTQDSQRVITSIPSVPDIPNSQCEAMQDTQSRQCLDVKSPCGVMQSSPHEAIQNSPSGDSENIRCETVSD